MGVSVLILGVSGTGKSTSLRNFKEDDIALVNVIGKPLPFRGKFTETLDSDDYDEVKNFMKRTSKKSIVVDDAQYLMGNEFMRRATEKGYDKFSELAQNFYKLLEVINKELPADKIVYLLGHIERDQDGNEKFKTMGKLIDNCINVEGTCTVVLKTCVADGKYTFLTQNSGKDTVKSPRDMFPTFAIDNDLKYVDDKIRNYWQFDGAVSDEEIKAADAQAASDVTEDDAKGKRKKRSRRKADEPAFMEIPETDADEVPFEEDPPEEKPKRQRKARQKEEAPTICTGDMYFYLPTEDNYIVRHEGESYPENGKEITKEDFDEGVKRLSGTDAEAEPAADAPAEEPTTRRRRRRRQ